MKAYIGAHYAVLCPSCFLLMPRNQRVEGNASRISVHCMNTSCSEFCKPKTYERLSGELTDA